MVPSPVPLWPPLAGAVAHISVGSQLGDATRVRDVGVPLPSILDIAQHVVRTSPPARPGCRCGTEGTGSPTPGPAPLPVRVPAGRDRTGSSPVDSKAECCLWVPRTPRGARHSRRRGNPITLPRVREELGPPARPRCPRVGDTPLGLAGAGRPPLKKAGPDGEAARPGSPPPPGPSRCGPAAPPLGGRRRCRPSRARALHGGKDDPPPPRPLPAAANRMDRCRALGHAPAGRFKALLFSLGPQSPA